LRLTSFSAKLAHSMGLFYQSKKRGKRPKSPKTAETRTKTQKTGQIWPKLRKNSQKYHKNGKIGLSSALHKNLVVTRCVATGRFHFVVPRP
jgi:hypothetical protein